MTDQQKAWLEGLVWAAASGVASGVYTSYLSADGKVQWGAVVVAALGGVGLFLRNNAKAMPEGYQLLPPQQSLPSTPTEPQTRECPICGQDHMTSGITQVVADHMAAAKKP